MQSTYYGKNIILKAANPNAATQVLAFYERNKQNFDPWEPDRPERFYTLQYHKLMLANEMQMFTDDCSYRFFVFLKNRPDYIVGCVCISNIIRGSFQSAHIAYKTDIHYLHQGISTQAMEILIQLAFDEARLHRLVAYIHPNNLPSIRFIEKMGFQKEGTARDFVKKHDVWLDHLVYAKLQ